MPEIGQIVINVG